MTGRPDDEFTLFVIGRLGPLRRIAYLLCQDWQRADDLVQAAITRLYMCWDRARELEHIEAYLRTILIREYLGERRSAWARRVIALDLKLPGTDHTPLPDSSQFDSVLTVFSHLRLPGPNVADWPTRPVG